MNCNQEVALKTRTFGFDAVCDCQLSRHPYYYHNDPYFTSLYQGLYNQRQ